MKLKLQCIVCHTCAVSRRVGEGSVRISNRMHPQKPNSEIHFCFQAKTIENTFVLKIKWMNSHAVKNETTRSLLPRAPKSASVGAFPSLYPAAQHKFHNSFSYICSVEKKDGRKATRGRRDGPTARHSELPDLPVSVVFFLKTVTFKII